MYTVPARTSIPDDALDVLERVPGAGKLVGQLRVRARNDNARQEPIERIEFEIADQVASYLRTVDRPRNVQTLILATAMRFGVPYGTHDVWLDRNDIATLTGNLATHVNALMRRGVFDLIEYGHNYQQRAAKRYATRQSVETFVEMRDRGMSIAEIEQSVNYGSVVYA